MKTLVIAGLGDAPGKSAVAAGLAARWQAAGRKAAYTRAGSTLEDQAFFDRLLPPPGGEPDVRLVELDSGDTASGVAADNILLVAGYRQGLTMADITAAAAGMPGLAGVLVNGVPERTIPLVQQALAPLPQAGVRLLGLVPEERALLGVTVEDLATQLGAEYLSAPRSREILIENLMIGANITDTATVYFVPRRNMAVFCRADRPDHQLAALNNDARCLVLTGYAGYAQTSVVFRAEDLGVPVLRVPSGIIETVGRLDGLLEGRRFRHAAKAPVMRDLLARHAAVDVIDELAGLVLNPSSRV